MQFEPSFIHDFKFRNVIYKFTESRFGNRNLFLLISVKKTSDFIRVFKDPHPTFSPENESLWLFAELKKQYWEH